MIAILAERELKTVFAREPEKSRGSNFGWLSLILILMFFPPVTDAVVSKEVQHFLG